jgi:hypothetical protein
MVALSVFASDEATPTGGIVDRAHPNETARRRFGRRTAFGAAALAWTAQTPVAGADVWFALDEHIGWVAPDAPSADPLDVVKQVSFLHKSDTVDLVGFRRHYRHHVEVARRHMHTLWQYVQYDVTAIGGPGAAKADGIVAVSVLWFRSTDDFLHRYFASAEDQQQFQSEEGFLDLTKAFSFVISTQPPAGPADRPPAS